MEYGKKRRIPRRRNAGKYGKSYETGAEDAASDGRTGKRDGNKRVYSYSRRRSGRSNCFRNEESIIIKADEEAVDPDDVEMLEDLIVAALNEALEKVDAESSSAMSKLTGGMGGGMPGLF